MTNNRRVALALNNLATVLQQLAVELTEDQGEPPVHPLQLTTEQLRVALVGTRAPVADDYTMPTATAEAMLQSMSRPPVPTPLPPASVAEPECGCSLYARCDAHEAAKPRGCRCNGPYRSSDCRITEHAAAAEEATDPALVD